MAVSNFLFSLIYILSFFSSPAFSQDKFPAAENRGIIIYGLETEDEKLRHSIWWAPFNPETGLYVGMDRESQKKNKKALEQYEGEELFEGKRDGKKVRRVYFHLLPPGTYVLHSVRGKGSTTTFHPETFGFEIKAGEVLFLGDFSINQKNDVFRSLIDPNLGVTINYLGADFSQVEIDQDKIEKYDLQNIRDYVRETPPLYFEVKEYE